jgi:hypothetical protein
MSITLFLTAVGCAAPVCLVFLTLLPLIESYFKKLVLQRSVRQSIVQLDAVIAEAEAPFVTFGLPEDQYMSTPSGYQIDGAEELITGNPMPRSLHCAKYFRQMAVQAVQHQEWYWARTWVWHAQSAMHVDYSKWAGKYDAAHFTRATEALEPLAQA